MSDTIKEPIGQGPDDVTAAGTPPAQPTKSGHVSISTRWLYIVGGVVLGLILLGGVFATGVAVGSHAGRFGGRGMTIERGLQNGGTAPWGMQPGDRGQFGGQPGQGQGYGRGRGYHDWNGQRTPWQSQPTTPTQ